VAGNGGSGKIPAWTPAGGIRGQSGAVGRDSSCRCTGRSRGGGDISPSAGGGSAGRGAAAAGPR
jgi:hypothetical protein